MLAQYRENGLTLKRHWLNVSNFHRHPLSFFVAFATIQHQWSLLSVMSANQQPAIHKAGTSCEVDRDWSVVFRGTPAHPLPTHGNLCTQCSLFCTLWLGHRSERSGGFPTHLDAAVQRVAVKSLIPGSDY